MSNYKDDDSFFTHVLPPATLFGSTIYDWFNNNGKFRLIRDAETEFQYMNLQQIDELYPGVKTFAIIINPWARMRYAYLTLLDAKEQGGHPLHEAFNFNLDSFEEFILNLPSTKPSNDFWFTPTTPIVKWLEYEDNGTKKTVDYILRAEHLDEDLQPLKEYFCSTNSPIPKREIPSYKEYYTDEMRQVIADIFKEDIEKFGYEF